MAGRIQGRRGILAALTAAAVALPLALGAFPAQAQEPVEPRPSAYLDKTEGLLIERLATKGRATFWVALTHEADTSAARKAKGKTAKARTLYETKTAYAKKSQAPLRALLDSAGARYEAFWITNTLKVTAGKALAEKIAARADVAALEADDPITIPDPLPGRNEPRLDAVEWNIDRIGAPKVWSELGVRGEGVVVANIDSGVQHDHPAVKAKYRGLKSDGSYDHAYNWFDPAKVCTGTAPCDNNGHGTHTMGTMVGDDGAGNQVGVAPDARWIAAKGCETSSCSRDSLLRSGQWVVAPTDASGANPRPDLAPDVVNNSWGSGVIDTWYKATVQSWRDAGIFPAFSNGNSGPSCNTSGSPGAYTNSYSTGAFDINNAIASFSSRGTGESGGIKPNLAGPGVNVRSSWAGGGYHAISGTSMASPHTAATVALMWSAAPAIRGNVTETEKLLDSTAVDVDSTTCGGTAADNNVFGEGRLDAYAAVTASPRGALGAVSGKVTTTAGPLADATLRFEGPMKTTVTTGADGGYALPKLMVGDYTVSVAKFGYVTAQGAVTVVENGSAVKDFALAEAASADVSGKVTSHAGAEASAVVTAQGTPVSGTSGTDGSYTLRLPVGTYDLAVTPAHRCASATSVRLEVTGSTTKDIRLPDRTDTFGTACSLVDAELPAGATKLAYTSTTFGTASFDLPFPVAFYGRTYRAATASIDGVLSFGTASTSSTNSTLPTTFTPNGSLYPFWDNLTVDADAGVYWSATGTAPHRKIVVEWRNALIAATTGERVTFAAVLGEDGSASFHYQDISGTGFENGSGATIGAENATGTDALLYSFNEGTVRDGLSIGFRTTRSAVLAGTATDANDGKPVSGAALAVSSGGTAAGSDTAGADGGYLLQVPADAVYDLAVSAPAYSGASARQTPKPGEIVVSDAALRTGRVAADSAALTVVVPATQQRTRTLTLANTGSATPFTVTEKDGKSWIKTAPGAGQLAAGAQQKVALSLDTAGAAPGTVLSGTLQVKSESGRKPVIDIPVTVVVPAYRTAIDSGTTKSSVDALGDTWGPDRRHAAGSYGYLGSATDLSTTRTITGAADPTLYRTARQGMYEYRFDGLPAGTYRVELGFAELSSKDPSERVFDVMAEGTQFVPNLDLALEAGIRTAQDRAFTVQVTDGQLNLRFVANSGKTLVNSIRVTERPDLVG
ncbi:S8 family serine peptidase [Streptomyces sp. NBC_01142]|uniref:S8 family serine peptidase n=1 Tax=Streptomyces sp. NBC_01142 TaxID=2975865 RepID=UPI00225A82E0|nr:S8 family serine peptidase [Streptomyces sp. NBC_01142]MCX4822267.1 S8 family serine peptidase [Streptomyces sp. NBC_01142]